jgi:Complex1_LYR-like
MAPALPASSLYRSILRAHKRYLPQKMKELGDIYVKSEFRLHKGAQPEQARQFLDAWHSYLSQTVSAGRAREAAAIGSLDTKNKLPENSAVQTRLFQFGADLPADVDLSEDRAEQLKKLKAEIDKAN